MTIKKIFLAVIILLLFSFPARAVDLCQDYIIDVRNQHTRYFGPTFPWWYGLGQLRQESCCRSKVTAFDHGMGIAQFMPATHKYVEGLIGEKLDPYNPHQAIRMQAFYMHNIHKQNKFPNKPLWVTYQAYNGGWTMLNREKVRANSFSRDEMRKVCNRKIIKLKGGNLLDMCEVNYDYSRKVFLYGSKYKTTKDNQPYW